MLAACSAAMYAVANRRWTERLRGVPETHEIHECLSRLAQDRLSDCVLPVLQRFIRCHLFISTISGARSHQRFRARMSQHPVVWMW